MKEIIKNWYVPVKGMILFKVNLQIQCVVVSGVP